MARMSFNDFQKSANEPKGSTTSTRIKFFSLSPVIKDKIWFFSGLVVRDLKFNSFCGFLSEKIGDWNEESTGKSSYPTSKTFCPSLPYGSDVVVKERDSLDNAAPIWFF